MKVKIMF